MNEYSFTLWHDLGMVATASTTSRRTASREARRQQLIDATMKCIARKGMSSTTLSDVAREAGLSQGIVNLHFESKDNLLAETLASLAGEYRDKFDRAVENSGPGPADKLWAIMEHDLRPSICNRAKLAVWFAFWGEVRSRPTYQRMCAEWDQRYDNVVAQFCEEIVTEGGYRDVVGSSVAYTLAPMINGFWLSCLISPQTWSRDAAKTAVMNYLNSMFPNHFPRQH
ncbi:MAG: TetR family transcriptional regulator C-terminal domain-containing protein [Woeseiaceae bacterium]